MVAPLKTWHHPQPKGLWPAVTGLAVATHVGILGLSLPYVLNLMRSGESNAANFVPVELIEVEPTDALSASETSDVMPSETPTEQIASVETAQPTVTTSNDDLTTPAETDVAAVPKSEVEPAEPETEPDAEQTTEPELENETETQSETTPDAVDEGTTDSEIESEPEQTNDSVDAQSNESANESGVESSTETDFSETAEPPVISGDQDLPLPGEGEAAVSSSQVAYIRVVGHSYVPEDLRRDIADILPEPVNYPEVQLDADAVGCGQVEFPVGQVAYRVVVDPTGVVRQALPWTGGIERVQMREGERAIACLIESASFSFTPAMSEGTPVANSDLILTLDVIEASGG